MDKPWRPMRDYIWFIYIPNDGDWPIAYFGQDEAGARKKYLVWAGRKRLPKGAKIWRI